MGLLDFLTGRGTDTRTPEQQDAANQGLLSLGLNLMHARGPFGAAIGASGSKAMADYQAALDRNKADAMQKLMLQQHQLSIKSEQARLDQMPGQAEAQKIALLLSQAQLAQVQRQAADQKRMSELAAASVRTPSQVAMSTYGGPTNAAAVAAPLSQPGFDWKGYSAGVAGINPMTALEIDQKLKKEQPKLSKLEAMRDPSGRMVNVAVFEDGTTKVLPFGVKPEIALQSLGNQVMAIDKNTAQNGSSWTMGATPGEMLTNGLGRDRLAFDKNQAGKPTFHDGAWVTPPTAAAPNGAAVQVPGMPSKPLTENQGNAAAFSMKAQNALENLDKVNTVTNGDYYKSKLPWGTGNFMMSAPGQLAMNAEKQFLAAVLRKESGAAISQGEYTEYGDQYFPRPGDSQDRLAQKARNRQVSLAGMNMQAGSYGSAQAAAALSAIPPAALSSAAKLPASFPAGSTIQYDINGMMVHQ